MMKYTLPLLALLAALPVVAEAVTLTYRESNRWVAQEDIAPLRGLMDAARKGTRHFVVRLPESKRDLSVERLEILTGLLENSAKDGVILEEVEGEAPAANTLWVAPK